LRLRLRECKESRLGRCRKGREGVFFLEDHMRIGNANKKLKKRRGGRK
jgi:hypothetical protein